MTNQIITNTARALSFVTINPDQLAMRLKNLVSNGKKLANEEAIALAQYSVATGLNPFVGECYYLPGLGPGPGIAGWRVKAEEQLEYEAMKARMPAARFWCDYIMPEDGEADYDPAKGDIAVKAVLHDSISRTTWEQSRLAHYIELAKSGLKDGAWEIASELVGLEPVRTAVGIVRGSENFGSDKMGRYERACKRAEKAAIRKRFPRVHLPEPLGFDAMDVIDAELKDVSEAEPQRTTDQNLADLYGATTPTPDEPVTPPSATMSLETAEDVLNSEEKRYGDIDSETLGHMSRVLAKSIKTETDAGIKEVKQFKLDAIKVILASRQQQ